MKIKFKTIYNPKIQIGDLVEDTNFVGGFKIEIDGMIFSKNQITIIEEVKKNKNDLKELLLSRKKLVIGKKVEPRYECFNCKSDVRSSSLRANVIREDDKYAVWRFICTCGYTKTVTIYTWPK